MKKQAMCKTGLLKPHKTTRQQMANSIKKGRSKGYTYKKLIFGDAIAYQSDCKYDPYVYAVIK